MTRHQPQIGWATVQSVAVLVVDLLAVRGATFPTHAPQHTLPRRLFLHGFALLGRGVVAAVHFCVFSLVVSLFLHPLRLALAVCALGEALWTSAVDGLLVFG